MLPVVVCVPRAPPAGAVALGGERVDLDLEVVQAVGEAGQDRRQRRRRVLAGCCHRRSAGSAA